MKTEQETVTIKGRNRYADDALTTITIRDKYRKAVLIIEGGYIENRGDEFVIAAKHPTACDQENDSSYVAVIEGVGLVWKDMMGPTHYFTGVLLKSYLTNDEDAEKQIEKNGFLEFMPPARKWAVGSYTIEVEHSAVPINVKRLSPCHPLESTWGIGDRVEQCTNKGSGSNPNHEYRPGTVDRIDRKYGYHESLVIAFDDGETRSINPDVMRHIKEG